MEIHAALGNPTKHRGRSDHADVDEAVLLSRIVTETTTGARSRQVLDVPLARPRRRLDLVPTPTYIRCRRTGLKFR